MGPSFSIVIPTFRRAATLRRMLPSYLATSPKEVILVNDGSGPPHDEILADLARREGVRLVRLRRHLGLPSARNAGVDASTGAWIVFGEDDCWYPRAYPRTLIDHAIRAGADAASGSARAVPPELLDGDTDVLEAAIAAGPTMGQHPPDELLGARLPVETLSTGDLVTPMLTAGAAIRREVFDRVRFDDRYTGNAFREETDFFLACWEAGVRTIRCPHAHVGHVKADPREMGGGAWAMGRPRFAYYLVANNWRFVRKHASFLGPLRRETGKPGSAVMMEAEYVWDLLRRARRPDPSA
jgi:glycosyltransferase involved in cell wall biosynthesis